MKKIMTALAIILSTTFSSAAAGTQYIITLKNGNVLDANSVQKMSDKVRLVYPTGSAVIMLDRIASITDAGGGTGILQDLGKYQEKPKETVAPAMPVLQAVQYNQKDAPSPRHAPQRKPAGGQKPALRQGQTPGQRVGLFGSDVHLVNEPDDK